MSRCARAMTMMEVVLSIMLVGIVLAAALNTLGGARVARAQTADLSVAGVLADSLLSEILAQAYEGSDEGVGSFGIGASEIGDGSRKRFDDVDDYNGWIGSPPQENDGTPIPWASGYTRTVLVETVRASDFGDTPPDGVSLKRVTVTVRRGGKVAALMRAYRSPLWPDPEEVSP